MGEVCLMVRDRGPGCSLSLCRSVEVDRVLGRAEEYGLDGGHRGGLWVVESESVRDLLLVS